MAGITCYNIDGTPLNHLTQWDKNIVLILKGAETSPEPQIHFSNKRSQKAIIVDPQINGDSIYVDVPNVLLEDGYPLTIRIYYTYDDGSSRTRYTKFINVQPKAMPDDYVIEDTNEPLTEVDYSLYKDMPFKIIDLPLTENLVGYKSDGSTFSIKGCSPITKCPKYLGWRIDGDSRMYLYIGDMVNGQFIRDEAYTICVTSSNNVNYLNSTHSRFIETDGTKYFYYQKAKDDMLDGTSSIKLIGADVFPDSEEILATTPNYINNDSKPQIEGKYYSVVLPAGCDYAVFVKDDGSYNPNTLNVSYQTADGGIHLSLGASFGTIPEDAGAALIKIPNGCPLENVTVYTNKDVKIRAQRTQAKRIAKDVTEFQFFSKKGIYWDDSERPMEEGRRFCGVPYSSRWINSHHVGYEISPTTLANALNDPYSVAYDGGITDDGVWEISGKSEIYKESQNPNIGGGPGYGLVCSSFMMLMSGNPYPQTNRGFTFDTNFEVAPIMDYNAGMVVTNEKVQHCVYVQDIYESGNAVIEASTPCMAKTIHTNTIENPSYMATKTKIDYLDSFRYSVVNRDTSGYTKNLLDFDNIYIPSGNVRPWRGYKAVYGPWDKSYSGSGIGVTIHNDVTTVRLFVPGETNPVTWEVAAGTKYLDISDAVTVSGTYFVDSGTGTVQEKFRFFDHEPVTLSFDANGTAVFSDDKVEYAYIRVTGYGGEFNNYIDTSNESKLGGPIVIAAGKRYPDIAADINRIKTVYAAIISDDTMDVDGNQDCWGRYSVLINEDVRSEYSQSSGGNVENGEDGFSPIATVTQTDSGAVISITDKDGITTATITNGKDGKDGADGQPGKDGADGAPGEKGDKGDKGDTGRRGTGLLAVTTAPSSYTTSVGGITPKYRMAISTIKTQAGVEEVVLGDTVRYSYYHYPIDYLDASYAYFETRVSIRGAAGTTPVKGTDYYTDTDKTEMVGLVKAALPTVTITGIDADGVSHTWTMYGVAN